MLREVIRGLPHTRRGILLSPPLGNNIPGLPRVIFLQLGGSNLYISPPIIVNIGGPWGPEMCKIYDDNTPAAPQKMLPKGDGATILDKNC